MNTKNKKQISESVRTILKSLGENVRRDGLLKTPDRVAKSLLYLTSGSRDEKSVVEDCRRALFDEKISSHICVKNIEFYSLCEHHMLPFWGTISIAFIPNKNGKILGLSKFGRLVDVFSRRLQVQERIGNQLIECIYSVLRPQAIAVRTEAKHMCMMMRGVEKYQSSTVTYEFKGDAKFKTQLNELL